MKKINLAITGCIGTTTSVKSDKTFNLVLTENRIINKKINGIKPKSEKAFKNCYNRFYSSKM